MNIFVLDRDTAIAARYHNDKHCVKMILETSQLLSWAIIHFRREAGLEDPSDVLKYSRRHWFHPSTVWTRQSRGNFNWCLSLLQELMKEKQLRFGTPHKYDREGLLEILRSYSVDLKFPSEELQPFVQVFKNFPQCIDEDPVVGYRKYYWEAKQHLARWSAPAKVPDWHSSSYIFPKMRKSPRS